MSSLVLVSTFEISFCLSHSLTKQNFSKKIGVSGKVKLWRFSQFRLGGFLRTFLCYRLYVSETKTVTKPCSLF